MLALYESIAQSSAKSHPPKNTSTEIDAATNQAGTTKRESDTHARSSSSGSRSPAAAAASQTSATAQIPAAHRPISALEPSTSAASPPPPPPPPPRSPPPRASTTPQAPPMRRGRAPMAHLRRRRVNRQPPGEGSSKRTATRDARRDPGARVLGEWMPSLLPRQGTRDWRRRRRGLRVGGGKFGGKEE